MVKNSSSNAEDMDSIPGQGTKIPHDAGQPSPHTTTRSPCATTRETCVPQLRPSTANKQINE